MCARACVPALIEWSLFSLCKCMSRVDLLDLGRSLGDFFCCSVWLCGYFGGDWVPFRSALWSSFGLVQCIERRKAIAIAISTLSTGSIDHLHGGVEATTILTIIPNARSHILD